MEELLQDLSKIADSRRRQGLRHYQEHILFLVLLATLQGARGRRSIARFAQNNWDYLSELISFKSKKPPSGSTIERTLNRVDTNELSKVLTHWQTKQVSFPETLIVAGDAKSMRGTLQDAEGEAQNFVSVLSLFEVISGQVVKAKAYENGDKSEIHVFQQLVEDSYLGKAILMTDSLHCQKNAGEDCEQRV